MTLDAQLEYIGVTVAELEGIRPVTLLPTSASGTQLVVICGFDEDGKRSWLAVDGAGGVVTDREEVRRALAIAALCEVAADVAFPGDLGELRKQLEVLRATEEPAEVDAAVEAAESLASVIGALVPASPERLDNVGQAAQRLERALDPTVASPFAAAMRGAENIVAELWAEVESTYRRPFR